MFTPIILTCLIASPTQCRPVMGPAEPTEIACMNSLTTGLEFMATNRPDLYVAGLVCVETHLMDEAASNQ